MANVNLRAATAREIILVGSSVRAAAGSARRAGPTPIACDRFGDVDLRATARYVPPAGPYPRGLLQTLGSLPRCPWMFTGALENHPDLVAEMSAVRHLWGNGADVVRRVRDPFQVREALKDSPSPLAPVRAFDDPPAEHERWVVKSPTTSAAAAGRHQGRSEAGPATRYFQKWIPGRPCSALFVGSRGESLYLGATRQLVGEAWLDAPPLSWCGNVGPLRAGKRIEGVLRELGSTLAAAFRLEGLFGVDFIESAAEGPGATARVVPIEINPRYTGSVEVLEYARGVDVLELHANACTGSSVQALRDRLSRQARSRRRAGGLPCVGKAILYAGSTTTVETDLQARLGAPPALRAPPPLADLPAPGTRVEAGAPLLSFFASGDTESACLRELKSAAREIATSLTLTAR